LGLAWAGVGARGERRALVLTQVALEAWALPPSAGAAPLSSRPLAPLLSAVAGGNSCAPLALAVSPGADRAAVVFAAPERRLLLLTVGLGLETTPPGPPLAVRTALQADRLRAAWLAHGALLLLCPGAAAEALSLADGEARLRPFAAREAAAHGAPLAAGAAEGGALLLCARSGVMAALIAPPPPPAPSPPPSPPPPLPATAAGPPPAAASPAAAAAALGAAWRAAEAAGGAASPAALPALRAAGVFSAAPGLGAAALLAVEVLDTLPKRWGDAEAGGATLSALQAKLEALHRLLAWLRASGAWAALPPRDRAAALRCCEQAAAAAALRAFAAELQAEDAEALRCALAAAGEALGGAGGVEAPFERPSVGVALFLGAAEAALARAGAWAAAAPLAAALLRLLAAAEEERCQQAHLHPAPPPHGAAPLPDDAAAAVPLRWSCGAAARGALRAAAAAAAAALPQAQAASALLPLTQALLDACGAAAERLPPGSAARREAWAEHARLRNSLLPPLLAEAAEAAAAAAEGDGGPLLVPVSLDAVFQLAKSHRGDGCLYALCLARGDLGQLLALMRDLPGGGPDGLPPFAHAVFERMLEERRVAVLLDALPAEWEGPLGAWLEQGGPAARPLRWLAALRRGQLGDAAAALEAEGCGAAAPARPEQLRLAKLAHMAAARGGAEEEWAPASDGGEAPRRCDALCELAALQARLGAAKQPLQPAPAIAARLLAAAAPPLALRALACGSAAERQAHGELAAAAWRAAAEASDWGALAALRRAEGAERYEAALAAAPLARCARAALWPGAPLLQPPWGLAGGEELGEVLAAGMGEEGAAALRDALALGAAGLTEVEEEEAAAEEEAMATS